MKDTVSMMLMVAAPLWPLLLALSPVIPGLRAWAGKLYLSAPVPALLLSLLVSAELELEIPWLLLGGNLGLDETSRLFLFVSALLWLAAGYGLDIAGRVRFVFWCCLTMAGNFAVLLARDIPSFFFAYALMSLACFGLVVHAGSQAARYAAKVYLVFSVLGEMILLSALLWVAHDSQALTLPVVYTQPAGSLMMVLLFIGFGIKAGVPLLHLSLPPAYAVTPLPGVVPMAGALLHLGLYGWLTFLPLGQLSMPGWSAVFLTAGSLALFYGAVIGLAQREARALLAYSSMSQMGLMLLAIGIGLVAADAWSRLLPLLLLFTLYHALAKGALFYGLGLGGAWRLALWLPALTLAGLPFTGGALLKGLLKAELALLPELWSGLLAWLLPLGSLGTTLLMARFLYLSRKPDGEPTTHPMVWLGLIVGMLLLPWFWPLPLALRSPLWSALWPVAAGLGLAWLIRQGLWSGPLSRFPEIQPGDLLALFARVSRFVPIPQAAHEADKTDQMAPARQIYMSRLLGQSERRLGQWRLAMGLLLCLLLGLFGLLLVG